jgi:HlyD family secretion protein
MSKSLSRALFIGLVVAAACIGWSQLHVLARLIGSAPDQSTNSASEPHEIRIGALGRIEPCSEVLDIDASVGQRLLAVFVRDGQLVKKDDELAHLESHNVAVAEKQEIAALLDEARNRLKAVEANHQNAIRVAELKLQIVETIEPIRINAQGARIRALEVEHRLAETECSRVEKLHTTAAVSKDEYDRKQAQAVTAREMLEAARLALAELESNLKLATESARAELESAKSATAVSAAEIPVQSLERRLELAEARIQQTIIRAPIDGAVLKVLTHSGERVGVEPILKLGDTHAMHVVAEVYETDVGRVRVGQRAEVTSSALTHPLTGTVVQIGSMIFKNDVLNVDPAADADARVVEVRILLDEPEQVKGLTNLQVDVLIQSGPATSP